MFIDADIKFEPEAVIRLVRSDYDVSVAAYPLKGINWEQAEDAILKGDTRDPEKLASYLVLNFNKDNAIVMKDGFIECHDGPTGFMVIKRRVIEEMYKRYPQLNCVNDHRNREVNGYCAIFDCMIDPDNRRYLSEDYAFCRRWQQMGGKVYADTNTTLGHVGNIRFTGCLHKALESK